MTPPGPAGSTSGAVPTPDLSSILAPTASPTDGPTASPADRPTDSATLEEKLQRAREAKANEAKNPEEYIVCLNSDGTLAGVIHGHPRPGVKPRRDKAFKENACDKQFKAKWEVEQ